MLSLLLTYLAASAIVCDDPTVQSISGVGRCKAFGPYYSNLGFRPHFLKYPNFWQIFPHSYRDVIDFCIENFNGQSVSAIYSTVLIGLVRTSIHIETTHLIYRFLCGTSRTCFLLLLTYLKYHIYVCVQIADIIQTNLILWVTESYICMGPLWGKMGKENV